VRTKERVHAEFKRGVWKDPRKGKRLCRRTQECALKGIMKLGALTGGHANQSVFESEATHHRKGRNDTAEARVRILISRVR